MAQNYPTKMEETDLLKLLLFQSKRREEESKVNLIAAQLQVQHERLAKANAEMGSWEDQLQKKYQLTPQDRIDETTFAIQRTSLPPEPKVEEKPVLKVVEDLPTEEKAPEKVAAEPVAAQPEELKKE